MWHVTKLINMIILSEAQQEFNKHVLEEYPKEACGVIVNNEYVRCRNVASNPHTHFKISPLDYFDACKINTIQAILHSHPYDSNKLLQYPAYWPSGADMAEWMKGTIPWGIASTEGENVSDLVWLQEEEITPLVGREFIHGIYDCYSLCRDYYKLHHNLVLPNYVRDMSWWKKGEDLYSNNFKLAGFQEVELNSAKYSDAFLIMRGSRVINHAAIYTGENQILDHLVNRLSGYTTLSGMAPYIVKAVRHKDLF